MPEKILKIHLPITYPQQNPRFC